MAGSQFRLRVDAAPTSGTLPVAQQFAPSGMSGTPNAALLNMTSGVTAGTMATPARRSYGAVAGSTKRSIGRLSKNGTTIALTDSAGRMDVDTVIQQLVTNNANRDSEASHVSFAAGVHNIEWPDLPATAMLVVDLLIMASAAGIVDYTGSSSNNTAGTAVDITGTGYNLAFVFGRGTAAFSADANYSPGITLDGMACKTAAGGIEQACLSDVQGNNAATIRTRLSAGYCAMRVTPGADGGALEVTTWSTTQWNCTTRVTGEAVAITVLFLALPDNALRIVSGTTFLDTGGSSTSTSTTGVKRVTGLGIYPKCYRLIGTKLAALDASETDTDAGLWSIGWRDDAGDRSCLSYQSEDNDSGATNANSRSGISTDKVARVVNNSGSDVWAADHSALIYDEVQLNVTTASSAATAWAMLVIGVDALGSSANDVAAPDFTATGTLTNPATSANDVAAPDFNATGTITMLGTAAMSVAAPDFSGTGTETENATASMLVAAPDFSGTGTEAETGSSSALVAAPDFSATGTITMLGTAAMSVAAPDFNAMGTASGTCHLELAAPDFSATGTITMLGTAAMSVAAPDLASSGTEAETGSSSLRVAAPDFAGTGTITLLGTAAMSVAAPDFSGAGVQVVPLTPDPVQLELRVPVPSILGLGPRIVVQLELDLRRTAELSTVLVRGLELEGDLRRGILAPPSSLS